MSIKKFPLEAYGAAVSREELVQAALDEITKNYREASLSNVARSYGVSLDRKSTRLNSSHIEESRMPSSA